MANELGPVPAVKPHESRGSVWPIVVAIGLTCAIIGFLTQPAVSLIGPVVSLIGGMICVGAIVAWGLERFPGPSDVSDGMIGARAGDGTRSGRWGLIWFISTEAMLFFYLIAGYLYLRLKTIPWPPAGAPHLDLTFASINTVILLASTIPAYYAERAIRKDDIRGTKIGLLGSALLGLIFLSGQAFEYARIGFTPQSNIFLAGFFTLTGLHGAHVVAGISLLLVMFILAMRGRFSARNSFGIEFAATYWHFVDVVWVFLFTLLYLLQ